MIKHVALMFLCFTVNQIEAKNLWYPNQLVSDTSIYPEQKVVYRANLTSPFGIFLFGSAEIKLFKNLTFVPQLGINSVFGFSNYKNRVTAFNRDVASYVGYAAADLRYYFNINHRVKKQKNTDLFSGNYIALRHFLSTPSFQENNQSFMFENMQSWQFHLGTQHTFKQKLTIGGNIGYIIHEKKLSAWKNTNTSLYPYLQLGVNVAYVFDF